MLYVRNVFLLVVIVTAFSGLVMADFYLRHEVTGKTRRSLKQQGVQLNSASVIKAVRAGDLELLESLQGVGVDLGDPEMSGETALLAALKSGNAEVRDYLLGKKSVIRTLQHRDKSGNTALLVTIKEGDYVTANKLIVLGAKMGGQGEAGESLIMTAMANDDSKLFDFLIEQGVSVKEKNAQGLSPLVVAVNGEKKDWVIRLLKAGADANQTGARGEKLLLEAVESDRTELVKTLIQYGAKVDVINKSGETALMMAAAKANRKSIAVLLDAGADTDVNDESGLIIQGRLIDGGDVELVEFFASKIDGGITDDWMVKVFEAGQSDLLQGLIKKGGDVEAKTEKGARLLKRAVLNKDLPMVELLLSSGADPKGEVWDALASGDRDVLEKLLIQGANANESLAAGVGSPLSLALRQKRYDSAEILLQHGADPDPHQADGRSLLEEAKSRLDERAVSLLKDYCAGYREEVVLPKDAEAEQKKTKKP